MQPEALWPLRQTSAIPSIELSDPVLFPIKFSQSNSEQKISASAFSTPSTFSFSTTGFLNSVSLRCYQDSLPGRKPGKIKSSYFVVVVLQKLWSWLKYLFNRWNISFLYFVQFYCDLQQEGKPFSIITGSEDSA